MTIMVDELRRWPTRIACFRSGSAHLTVDSGLGDVEELHAFAARIGLRRAWFQSGSTPHYDLTPGRRAAALRAGAVFVPGKEQAAARNAARRKHDHRVHGDT